MTRDDILAAFDRIRVWQRGDRRAVHKPLLVLLALGRLTRGEAPIVEFAEIEGKLGALLKQFGPSGSESTRRNPFWHLKTDGLWQLVGPPKIITRPPAATPNALAYMTWGAEKMNKWLLGLIVVFVLAGLILVLMKRLQASGSGALYRSRELMTPNEIEFFGRLNRALPGLNVFPQVSMAALIEPTGTKRTGRWTAAFNRIQAKRVDFVIADEMGQVRAVVEIDDRTHSSSKDKDRDSMLQSAGLRVLRWQSRDKPSEAAISIAVVGSSEPKAPNASATV